MVRMTISTKSNDIDESFGMLQMAIRIIPNHMIVISSP